jgi:endoglycosylceramidase
MPKKKLTSVIIIGILIGTQACIDKENLAMNAGDDSNSIDINSSQYKHNLSFDSDANARRIVQDSKAYNGITDRVFRDGLGREVTFRGFNVSGEVKLMESGFKPFRNTVDAATSIDALGQMSGANLVRFTMAWEGVHTTPDVIDYDYLDSIIAQMKEAVRNQIYLVVDYHSDLYSRHTFTQDSKNTGNGAPYWIVNGGNHGTDGCGLPCDLTWSAHKLSDPAVRSAMRSFWLNDEISTSAGTRRVQEEFIWQLGEVAKYIEQQLTEDEFDYVLGCEPINEPFDGGIEELGIDDYDAFDNLILWPFYERVRAEMDANGWAEKWIFAEPLVFWSSLAGIVAPATGGGYLDYKPGDGFVFAPHFYDQGRMGTNDLSVARNGTYFNNLDLIRDESRFLDLPVFLGEFGMWLEGYGHTDTERIVNATYQGMEISDQGHGKDRFADFYTPVVSGTQWQWDYYYDNHYEFQNGNPDELRTEDDAWNGENFSVINNFATGYNVDQRLIERAYPRRLQGDLMHFHYNAMVRDEDDEELSWGSIRLDLGDLFENREYFRGKKFAIAIWRGRNADAPTEIFLPRHMDAAELLVVTEAVIENKTLAVTTEVTDQMNEVMVTTDPGKISGSGNRLLVWDDDDEGEDANTMHYVLIVENADLNIEDINDLQAALTQRIQQEQLSPVYLTGTMTHSGYPDDEGDNTYFSLVDQRAGKCLDVAGAYTWNGTNVQLYRCNDSNAQKWRYDKTTGELKNKLNWSKCLDIDDGAISEGTNLQLWDCNNSDAQKFDLVDNTIRARADNNLAVDAYGSDDSTNVGLWTVNGSANQSWKRQY